MLAVFFGSLFLFIIHICIKIIKKLKTTYCRLILYCFFFSDLQALMYVVAGLVHDMDHRGTTNSFQIQGRECKVFDLLHYVLCVNKYLLFLYVAYG